MTRGDGVVLEKATQPASPAAPPANDDIARALVRLIQCSQCSRPFRNPVTLPCGNSLCKQCLPAAHDREHISYPDLPGRRQGFECPFAECGREHPAAECNVDVTLTKVMDSIAEVVARQSSLLVSVVTTLEAVPHFDQSTDVSMEKALSHKLPGGRLIATYTLAAQGNLSRDSDVSYLSSAGYTDAVRTLDESVLEDLNTSTQKEVDCQVCYNVMLDPVTTFCGHTLCRNCLVRVLDHSLHCPVCRRDLPIPASLSRQPSNKALVALLNRLCPDLVAARAEAVASEERTSDGYTDSPLFVCTLSFPNQPTFLRIFEPRYRLMLRRCMEGNQQFGMLMYNRYSEPQADLGPVHFYHYGTMLKILHVQLLPDGTSLVETRGAYRFRVKSHRILDGYSIGDVERIDDVPLAEEERLEAEETSQPLVDPEDLAEQISRMPTSTLLAIGREFIARMQSRSANWLQQRVLDVQGPVPQDPADFPYWFASVLPISDEEKYKLLGTRTVRERLKITAGWIRGIESQRWYQSNSCRIL